MLNPPDRTVGNKEKYFLVLQFDKEQFAQLNPQHDISRLAKIPLEISTDEYGNPLLTISSTTLADIDRAHNLV